jgi:hypothetical protein
VTNTEGVAARRDGRTTGADNRTTIRFGFWVAVVTGPLTLMTFALALTTIPNAVPRSEAGSSGAIVPITYIACLTGSSAASKEPSLKQ